MASTAVTLHERWCVERQHQQLGEERRVLKPDLPVAARQSLKRCLEDDAGALGGDIVCQACTYVNDGDRAVCEMCGTAFAELRHKRFPPTGEDHEDSLLAALLHEEADVNEVLDDHAFALLLQEQEQEQQAQDEDFTLATLLELVGARSALRAEPWSEAWIAAMCEQERDRRLACEGHEGRPGHGPWTTTDHIDPITGVVAQTERCLPTNHVFAMDTWCCR